MRQPVEAGATLLSDSAAFGLIDLHNHLLPGVDDGARTLAESVRHLERVAEEGVRRLAVTPHLNGLLIHEDGALHRRLADLESAFGALAATCRARGRCPRLVFAQEILVPDAETARALLSDPRVGYRGTRYCLLELGFHLRRDATAVIAAARACGRRPVIAHPERYVRDERPVTVEELESWKRAGALLQVNGGSLLGCYGDSIAQLGWRLLELGLADLIASDHHADFRPISLARVRSALIERGGAEQALRLLSRNPARILADRDSVPRVAPLAPGAVLPRQGRTPS
jgi:protein-tyrosine phosphatase